MKKLLKSWALLLIAIAASFSACNKKLEEYNPSNLTATTVYTKAVGFETLVNAAYTYTRFWYGKEEGYLASEMGTDIWTSGTGDPYPMFTQYINFQGTADPLPLLWNNLYAGVNLCNTGIAQITGVTDYTPAQKLNREAELRRGSPMPANQPQLVIRKGVEAAQGALIDEGSSVNWALWDGASSSRVGMAG